LARLFERFRKISSKEETMKLREFNQFQKKVPKNAEAANIQVCLIVEDAF